MSGDTRAMFSTTKRQNQIAGRQTTTTLALRMAWQMNQPLGFNAGQTNLYQYVGNAPTNQIDPSGLDGIDDLKKHLKKTGENGLDF